MDKFGTRAPEIGASTLNPDVNGVFAPYVLAGNFNFKQNKMSVSEFEADNFVCQHAPDTVHIPTQLPYGKTNLQDCTRYAKDSKAVTDYNAVKKSVIKITGERGNGEQATSPYASGFFVTPDGMIATDLHTLRGLKNIKVKTENGKTYKAFVVAVDRRSDIAILQIENPNDEIFKALPLGSSKALENSDQVTAYGYPLNSDRVFISPGGNLPASGFRQRTDLRNALETGAGRALSQDELNKLLLSGEQADREVLQNDILVNLGNSGGPLTDRYNQVVGIIGFSDIRKQAIATPVEPVIKLLNFARNQKGRPGAKLYFDEEDVTVQETPQRAAERVQLRGQRLELEINMESIKPPKTTFGTPLKPRRVTIGP